MPQWANRCLAVRNLKVRRSCAGAYLRSDCTLHKLNCWGDAATTGYALPLQGLQDAIDLSVTHPTWQRTRPDDPNDEHTG